MRRAIAIAAVFAACCFAARAEQEVYIEAFQSNGQLVFDRVTNADSYRVEWAPTADGPWTTFVGEACTHLHDISGAGSGLITATVPMMYRVAVTPVTTGDFVIVDLSGGPSVTNYPVSYVTSVPRGGWTEEHKTTKLVLRRIPAGTFIMGSPTNEVGRGTWPGGDLSQYETLHEVTLTKDFYIGVFEVTQKQWERVMGNWPSYFIDVNYRDNRPVDQVSYYEIRENPDNSDDPAVYWPSNSVVNANSFMGKLRVRTGLAFDLPTESQWEYACRAGTTTALNSGQNLSNPTNDTRMDLVGRYSYNTDVSDIPYFFTTAKVTAVVGSYQPNAWGLYDMHGNVAEWCLDFYGLYPVTATDPEGSPENFVGRVMRGGSFLSNAGTCRSAYREFWSPEAKTIVLSGVSLITIGGGVRAAITLP